MCMKGCLGCQYENTNDIFYPVESVCKLFKVTYLFLNLKFQKMMKEDNITITLYPALMKLNTIIHKLLESEEGFLPWVEYIQNLI